MLRMSLNFLFLERGETMEKKYQIDKEYLPFWIAGIVILLFGKSILKVGFTLLFKISKFFIRSIFIY